MRVPSDLFGLGYCWCFCGRVGGLVKGNEIFICNLSGLWKRIEMPISNGREWSPVVVIIFK